MSEVKKELKKAYDVLEDIIRSQPAGEIKIILSSRKKIVLECADKTYVMLEANNKMKLMVNGVVTMDDIQPLPKTRFISGIEKLLSWNPVRYQYRKFKNLKTGEVIFIIKKTK